MSSARSESIFLYFRLGFGPRCRNNYGMGRPKGLAKTGGRKLGTPNRNSQVLSERLESLGCDPIEGLAKIALDPATKQLPIGCQVAPAGSLSTLRP
jgi:hypothetical protein